jgi:hypothetical protein
VLPDIYRKPRGIHFRHHTTPENWTQYGQAITPLLLGERPLVEGLRELNRLMNERWRTATACPTRGSSTRYRPARDGAPSTISGDDADGLQLHAAREAALAISDGLGPGPLDAARAHDPRTKSGRDETWTRDLAAVR